MADPNAQPTEYSQSNVEKVRVFFEALTAGQDAGEMEFGLVLLRNYAGVVKQSLPGADDLTGYELLLEIARGLLESELVDALTQFSREGANKKELAAMCAAFWSALLLHIQLFFRQPPLSGRPLVVEIGGEYRITFNDQPPVIFQDPLSTAKLKSLLTTLGEPWVERYLQGYMLNKKIQVLYHGLAGKRDVLMQWLADKTSRWINKSQAAFCSRLWEAQIQQPVINPEIERKRFVREMISSVLDQALGTQKAALQAPVSDPLPAAIPAWYADLLLERLSAQENQAFILPDLHVEDELGKRIFASPEVLLDIQDICLLAGLPGSGKTSLQKWTARNRLAEQQGLDVFVDLKDFVTSGLSSLFEYAADQLIHEGNISTRLDELRSTLIELDRQKMLYWHIDNWDRVPEDERRRCLSGIAGLSRALVCVEDAKEMMQLAGERGLVLSGHIFHILPWDDPKKVRLIEQYGRDTPGSGLSRIQELIQLLPGLSSLPAGLGFILENRELSLAEILVGFLNAQQISMSNHPVVLSVDRTGPVCEIGWGNKDVNHVFGMVSALLQRGPAKEFDLARLRDIDPIRLGSQLIVDSEDLDERIERAKAMLETGIRCGLLYRTGSPSYAFVVSELGCLLSAAAVYASGSSRLIIQSAQEYLEVHPQDPAFHILLSFVDLASGSMVSPSKRPIRPVLDNLT